jgi:hypothetical protein
VPTGRVLMNRFARDSRKWNVRVLLSSQIPADFLKIQGFVSLLDSVFVGRLDDEPAQADALRLLKVPVEAGYEQVVASLGRRPGGARLATERDRAPRQFIFGDGAGGVERIRVDFSGRHLEHLCTALDTTPDAQRKETAAAALAAGLPLPAPGPAAREAMAARAEGRGEQDPSTVVEPAGPDVDAALEAAADAELGLHEDELPGTGPERGAGNGTGSSQAEARRRAEAEV